MPLVPRHETEADTPPSPLEYLLLLVILIVVAVGYIFWWRHKRAAGAFVLEDLGGLQRGVRLSMEDDGPTAESFLTNNASSDSLPGDLEHQVPFLPSHSSDEAAALADPSNDSRFPGRSVVNPISHHVANSPTLPTKPLAPAEDELVDTSTAPSPPGNSAKVVVTHTPPTPQDEHHEGLHTHTPPTPSTPPAPSAASTQLDALDRELNAISHHNATGRPRAPASANTSPLDRHLVGTPPGADDPLGATSPDLSAAAHTSPKPKPPSPHKYGRRSARTRTPPKRRGAIELSDSEDDEPLSSVKNGDPNRVFTLDDDDE